MRARILKNYWTEYSATMTLTCPACGWTGLAKDAPLEMYEDLVDRSCPECWKMLLIVPHPTGEQTRAAAQPETKRRSPLVACTGSRSTTLNDRAAVQRDYPPQRKLASTTLSPHKLIRSTGRGCERKGSRSEADPDLSARPAFRFERRASGALAKSGERVLLRCQRPSLKFKPARTTSMSRSLNPRYSMRADIVSLILPSRPSP